MARSRTLGQMRSDVRLRADMPGNQFVSDPEINEYLNQSIAELYDMLVGSRGQEYYVKTALFNTVAGQEYYPLPSDHYETLYLELNNNGSRQRLGSYSLHERSALIGTSGPATLATQAVSTYTFAGAGVPPGLMGLPVFANGYGFSTYDTIGTSDGLVAFSPSTGAILDAAVVGSSPRPFVAFHPTLNAVFLCNASAAVGISASVPLAPAYSWPNFTPAMPGTATLQSGVLYESSTGRLVCAWHDPGVESRLFTFDGTNGVLINSAIIALPTSAMTPCGTRPGFIVAGYGTELREYNATLGAFTTLANIAGVTWDQAVWDDASQTYIAIGHTAGAYVAYAIKIAPLTVTSLTASLFAATGIGDGGIAMRNETTGEILIAQRTTPVSPFAPLASVNPATLVVSKAFTFADSVVASTLWATVSSGTLFAQRYTLMPSATLEAYTYTTTSPETYALNPADATPRAFRVQASGLSLLPVPSSSGYQVQHFYAPACPRLVYDSDSFDGIDGWEEFAIWRAVVYVRQKEDLDVTVQASIMERLRKRIEGLAPFRAQQNTERVTDVTRDYMYDVNPTWFLPRP